MKDGNEVAHIVQFLKEKLSIVICLPIQPTLDASAAALALYLGLLKDGRHVTITCSDEINPDFMLPGQENVLSEIQAPGDTLVVSIPIQGTGVQDVTYTIENEKVNIVIKPEEGLEKFNPKNVQYSYKGGKPDLIITIYAPTLESLGELYTNNMEAFQGVSIINIDRHFTNSGFGTVNYVDKQNPSMAQMVFDILKDLKTEFDKDIATNLYAGLSTATNNFSAHTVNAQTFRLAALLLEKGAEKRAMRPLMPMQGMRMPMGGVMPSGFGAPPVSYSYPEPADMMAVDGQQMPIVQSVPISSQQRQPKQQQQQMPQQQQTAAQQRPSRPQRPPQPQQDIPQIGTLEEKESQPQTMPVQPEPGPEPEPEDWLKPKIFQGNVPAQGGGGMKV